MITLQYSVGKDSEKKNNSLETEILEKPKSKLKLSIGSMVEALQGELYALLISKQSMKFIVKWN